MNVFSWFGKKEESTPTRTMAKRPAVIDKSEALVANDEMLTGLYHGNYAGLQFASPLAYTPIAIPVNMMGVPTPVSDDEATQQMLNLIVDQMRDMFPKINRTMLLLGTAWRWPRFDSKRLELVWEPIADKAISDILVDVVSGRPTQILTDEMIRLAIGENAILNSQRKRIFTTNKVSVKWLGQKPPNANDYSLINVAGVLPIAFAHDVDEGNIRGYSALSRIIRDLKDYHDIDYRVSAIVGKYAPKQVQQVRDVGKWCENNLGSSSPDALVDYDISGNDLIINGPDELSDFKFLDEGAIGPHEKALERKFLKIVEGSGIPELFWGPLATGNNASTDKDKDQAIAYITAIREECTKAYYELFDASLRLMGIVNAQAYKPFKMGWNRLEAVSPQVKMQIFEQFANAIASMQNAATFTPNQLYDLWQANYPEIKTGTFEEFMAGLQKTAATNQFNKLDYFSGLEDIGGKSNA